MPADRCTRPIRRPRVAIVHDPASEPTDHRVTPRAIEELIDRYGLDVLVLTGSGEAIGIADEDYEDAGAEIVWSEEAWEASVLCCVNSPSAALVRERLDGAEGRALFFWSPTELDGEARAAMAESGAAFLQIHSGRDFLAAFAPFAGR